MHGIVYMRWLVPYQIAEHIGKGVYRLPNPATG